jgi:hypothetical protein
MTPQYLCGSDVLLLPLFCPASEKNHKRFGISAKINTVAWPEVDNSFQNPSADRFGVGPHPVRVAQQRGAPSMRRAYLGDRTIVQMGSRHRRW